MDRREGSLEAPTRHPVAWKTDEFYDASSLMAELERVFDICHGCRRCFNLCHSFPTLFDAVDESESMELDTVPKEVYFTQKFKKIKHRLSETSSVESRVYAIENDGYLVAA